MNYHMGAADVAVIGAGHAGIEAALAAARLGAKTIMFSISLENIANMPCNPSIGGTAKGHLVREIDALGGEMGKAADKCLIQSRLLNRGKGPAVHSLRAQIDRKDYHRHMKSICEQQENLIIKQAEITDILCENGAVAGVRTRTGAEYSVKAVIIAAGTYLNSLIHMGESSYESGPDSALPAKLLTESLKGLGISLRRFKTGTPARVHARSIDFDRLEFQEGDGDIIPFSFETDKSTLKNLVSCYIAYTNDNTHRTIKENLSRSPIYSGRIEGTGPRYCPSIEDKAVRFADKERHIVFVEPMGLDTSEYYLQGMSSSLPEDVVLKLIRTVTGLERAEIMRSAYAIEYDCCDPLELFHTLEFKKIKGLYGAGQFNGTSGYEEAAAQGLIAGINAARSIKRLEGITLSRSSSYIGTLIDDLVIKGCSDPYRMMTSRSEYRLLLRQDNADERLTPVGREIGLISDARYEAFTKKQAETEAEILRVKKRTVPPSDGLNRLLEEKGTAPIISGVRFSDLLRRPQLSYGDISPFDSECPDLSDEVTEQVSLKIAYEGYISRQIAEAERMKNLERKKLPVPFDYASIRGISLESAEKLNRVQPSDLGQAGRISGVSPADISVLSIWLSQYNKEMFHVEH